MTTTNEETAIPYDLVNQYGHKAGETVRSEEMTPSEAAARNAGIDCIKWVPKRTEWTAQQGAVFTAKTDFAFKAPRLVRVKAGSRWWQTNPTHDVQKTGVVMLHREGKGHICTGYSFTAELVKEHFTAETTK